MKINKISVLVLNLEDILAVKEFFQLCVESEYRNTALAINIFSRFSEQAN